jgi:hypothetical protein
MVLVFPGCASSRGTRPHDMSTTQHEAAAEQEQAVAEQHAEQYKAGAKAASTECGGDSICWTWTMNRAKGHEADAARHRELADKHRSGAKALRDAEASKCIGISESDRDMSPFYHREDIISVSKVTKTLPEGRAEALAPWGGRAIFRAVPGLTAEWLQRVVDCHIARAIAAGNNMPEMSYCPLMLKYVTATVSSSRDGLAVEVTADDPSTAEQVWNRMLALAPGQ